MNDWAYSEESKLFWASLTPRERECLELVGCCLQNAGIAQIMGLQESSVENMMTHIFNRFEHLLNEKDNRRVKLARWVWENQNEGEMLSM